MSRPPADPWLAGLTRDQQALHLAEAVRRIMHGEHTNPRPMTWAEENVDADTKIRGGKSRSALRAERRPGVLRIDTDGYNNHGGWHGTPGADFDEEQMLP